MVTDEEWIEQEKQRTFEKFFARYGVHGGWLEGYDIEPVIYWGA